MKPATDAEGEPMFKRDPEKKAAAKARLAEASEKRRAATADLRAAAAGHKDADDAAATRERVGNVRQYVKEHKAERIATVSFGVKTYSLYPDRIIRLPLMGSPIMDGTNYDDMMRRIEGVSAEVRESGSVHSRSTLTRTLVPGAHGWQKKTDDRSYELIVTGPDFVWTNNIDAGGPGGQTVVKAARQFAARVNNVGVGGLSGGTQEMW